jgi:excisionase family DNA binding protein
MAAEYLGRPVYSVRVLIWAGHLPVIRSGRKIYLDVLDLDGWIEKSKESYI